MGLSREDKRSRIRTDAVDSPRSVRRIMGLFSKKDWNVIAVIFETKLIYRVNGNRGKGSAAVTIRGGAKTHERTIFWAVFDQNSRFLEGEPGPGRHLVPTATLTRMIREFPTIKTVRDVLSVLESGESDKVSRQLEWGGLSGMPS